MYRLHGSDANYLYQETPTTPMHTVKIYMLKAQPGTTLNWDAIIKRTEALLPQLPMLRQRPIFVPFGLHHPVMIEDPDFDLDYHLCRAAVTAPGGMRELEAMIAQIASHPLDQHRPLWEMWYVEGLEGGRGACVHKIHHALADGLASATYIRNLWGSGAMKENVSDPPCWVPEKIPSRSRLIWDALVDHAKYDIRNLPNFIKTLWHSVRSLRTHSKLNPSPTMVRIRSGLPRLRWNYALSPKRSFATAQLPLAAVRELKSRIGGTVNDVVLALAAGSLRQYLAAHNELPDQPLIASIPMATDEKGSLRNHGNRIATITTLLHINIEDPLRRYRAIQESTNQGKAELDVMGKHTYGMLLHYTPPALLQWINQKNYRKRKANSPNYLPFSNLCISNVPGPSGELDDGENVVSELYSFGPLLDGMGLNITVWSYAGNLNFSILGCKKALPDIHKLGRGITDAMQELQQAALQMDNRKLDNAHG